MQVQYRWMSGHQRGVTDNVLTNSYQTLSLKKHEEHSLLVTLERPEVLNAMNTQMMGELRDIFQSLYVDQNGLRVVVITGSGERGFCSGGDLKERRGMTDAEWRRQHALLEQMMRAAALCPLPMIAAVNGDCFGGGLELALGCDFCYAADSARFGFPEGRVGIMPGAAGTQNLVRACGVRRAKEIMLTGLPFSSREALDWNVVNAVLPKSDLLELSFSTASKMCGVAPVSAMQIKKSLDMATHADIMTGYAFEIEAYNRTIPLQDRQEGINAFNEKRKPVFRGE